MKIIQRICSKINAIRGYNYFWEYYNRFSFVSNKIQQLPISNPKILDIGGATGKNLFEKFDVKNVTTLDINSEADIIASVDNIPLDDNSYDVVTCIDMLEHIPKAIREIAVNEILRVVSFAAFIIAPVNSDENIRAEKLVLKYTKNHFLQEHQRYGLVDFIKIESMLLKLKEKGEIINFEKSEIDDLLNWVSMMTRFNLFSHNKIYKESIFLENRFVPRRIALSIYVK